MQFQKLSKTATLSICICKCIEVAEMYICKVIIIKSDFTICMDLCLPNHKGSLMFSFDRAEGWC